MSAADSRRRLESFHAELDRLNEDGDAQTLVRWTGEQLAAANDRLAKSAAGDRTDTAAELLVISFPHVSALAQVGMPGEALATDVLTLLTVLHARVNPEDLGSLWLESLQGLCAFAAQYLAADGGSAGLQPSQIAGQIYGLFLATAHVYIPRFGASDAMRRFYDHLRHIASQAGEDISHFQGHRIVPTMAIDILGDTASRLASLGLMS